MKAQINGKGFSAILSIEEGKVTDVDNESISVFKFKNWDHVKERCGRYGWEVVEFPEVSEEYSPGSIGEIMVKVIQDLNNKFN